MPEYAVPIVIALGVMLLLGILITLTNRSDRIANNHREELYRQAEARSRQIAPEPASEYRDRGDFPAWLEAYGREPASNPFGLSYDDIAHISREVFILMENERKNREEN